MPNPSEKPHKRVYIACVECRRLKIKCKTDQYRPKPCKRCTTKGLDCKYLTVAEESASRRNANPEASSSVTSPIPPTSLLPIGPDASSGRETRSSHDAGHQKYVPSISQGFPSTPVDAPVSNRGGPGLPLSQEGLMDFRRAPSNYGPTFGGTHGTIQQYTGPQYFPGSGRVSDGGYYPYPWMPSSRPPAYPRHPYVSPHRQLCAAEINAGIAFAHLDRATAVVIGDE
ncbi:hypothetical protein K438DRAFT_1780697 [Mycena galopus ATCC 62051]|nr:hypothetical protein K438DRAFT_1780697 [Mycena galopus ATCC 62051]